MGIFRSMNLTLITMSQCYVSVHTLQNTVYNFLTTHIFEMKIKSSDSNFLIPTVY